MYDKLVYRVSEAAYMLNCSTGVIYKLIKNNRVNYYKSGKDYLITLKSLETYVNRKALH